VGDPFSRVALDSAGLSLGGEAQRLFPLKLPLVFVARGLFPMELFGAISGDHRLSGRVEKAGIPSDRPLAGRISPLGSSVVGRRSRLPARSA